MSAQLNKALKKLQSLKLKHADSLLWIVKRSLRGGIATYSVASVRTHQTLQKKLVEIVEKAIRSANQVEEYEFLTEDQDDDLTLSVKLRETDLGGIADKISNGSDNPQINSAEQLLDSWIYVIELHAGKDRVLAVRKIPEGWKLKQKEKVLSALFKNRMLLDFEEGDVFRLDKRIDFFAYDTLVFILNKKQFETAMNFRAGMERNRDKLLDDFQRIGLVSDVDLIRTNVGNRLGFLRRMSMIKKNGYYNRPGFINKLKVVCRDRGWAISFEGEKIVVTDENVELVLRLLNNDRLASLMTEEIFDVSVKKKVAE